eukprot:403341710
MKNIQNYDNDENQTELRQEGHSVNRKYIKLKDAVADLYLSIKQKTRDENESITEEEEKEEREIIKSLDPYIVIEYIKSSVDIILNLKFEEIEKRLLDKTTNPQDSTLRDESQRNGNVNFDSIKGAMSDSRHLLSQQQTNLAKSKNGQDRKTLQNHGDKKKKENKNYPLESIRSPMIDDENQLLIGSSSVRSALSNQEGPPKVYEELIQSLEADIRKHIRIEQQLKLHIESVENQIEEMETQARKYEKDLEKQKKTQDENKSLQSKVQEVESIVKQKEELVKDYQIQIQKLKDSETFLQGQIDKLKKDLLQKLKQNQDPIQLVLNSTQPFHSKTSGIQVREKPNTNKNQDAICFSQNQSFIDQGTPERKTPEIIHPYMQTQNLSGKNHIAKKSHQSGSLSVKQKFNVPQTLVDSLSFGTQVGATTATYNSTQNSGKLGQRKYSSQSRHSKGSKGSMQKNQWIGQANNNGLNNGAHTYSNIINNNISGLSINYSNQIIHNNNNASNQIHDGSMQQFANNFINSQNLLRKNNPELNEDSSNSNLNSHRRCKSQNVVHDKREAKSTKKSQERHTIDKRIIDKNASIDELFTLNDSLQKTQMTDQKYRKSNVNEDILQFDIRQQNKSSMGNNHGMSKQQAIVQNNNLVYDFIENQQNNTKRRIVKQNQISASTGSANTQQSLRNTANQQLARFNTNSQQQNYVAHPDELTQKVKLNQSFGNQLQNALINTNNTIQQLQKRNSHVMPPSQSSHSVEKHRSRNNKKQLSQNTTAGVMNKFDSSILDMHFKTTTSSSTQQSKNNMNNNHNQSSNINQAHFVNLAQQLSNNPNLINKHSSINHINYNNNSNGSILNSVTNSNIPYNNYNMMNQTSMAFMKQQLIANKKATNLLMKGLSPLKKQ